MLACGLADGTVRRCRIRRKTAEVSSSLQSPAPHPDISSVVLPNDAMRTLDSRGITGLDWLKASNEVSLLPVVNGIIQLTKVLGFKTILVVTKSGCVSFWSEKFGIRNLRLSRLNPSVGSSPLLPAAGSWRLPLDTSPGPNAIQTSRTRVSCKSRQAPPYFV